MNRKTKVLDLLKRYENTLNTDNINDDNIEESNAIIEEIEQTLKFQTEKDHQLWIEKVCTWLDYEEFKKETLKNI